MRPTVSLAIPAPCPESWDAMSPTATGRHCAACQKTVVDFTLKTDAEILAFLANAAGGRTCGRFAAGQLERPLQRAAPAAPTARWRAWLTAAVAVWGVREGVGSTAQAQAATEWRARYWGGPVPAAPPQGAVMPVHAAASVPQSPAAPRSITIGKVARVNPDAAPLQAAPLVLRGVVTDSTTREAVPGATVLIEGTTIGASTAADGSFELTVPAAEVGPVGSLVRVSSIGYTSQFRWISGQEAGNSQLFHLQNDARQLAGEVVIIGATSYRVMPPAPWHPRALFDWGKYWVTRPFRR